MRDVYVSVPLAALDDSVEPESRLTKVVSKTMEQLSFTEFCRAFAKVCIGPDGKMRLEDRKDFKNLALSVSPEMYPYESDSEKFALYSYFTLKKFKPVSGKTENLLLPHMRSRPPSAEDWIESYK